MVIIFHLINRHYEGGDSELWALRPWVFYGKVRSNALLKKMIGYAKF